MPATKTQEQRQSLIDGCDLFARKVAEYAANPALVYGSETVDQREGLSGKAAPAQRGGLSVCATNRTTGWYSMERMEDLRPCVS